MFRYIINRVKTALIDWLVIFVGVALILWFFFTAPVIYQFTGNVKTQELNINQNDLKNHVGVLSNFYAPRTVEFGRLNATAEYIYKEFEKYGRAQYQPYWTLVSNYKNVILELGPKTKEILVIGAHFDSQNDALDVDANASGIAALIELAHQLSRNEDKLSIGIQLVAYPLSQKKSAVIEDLGSYKHARMLFESGRSVKLMLSLDSVGSFNDAADSQKYPSDIIGLFYPDKGDFVALVARLQDYSEVIGVKRGFKAISGLPIFSFSMPESYYPLNSQDHLNYQRYGYPAMVITDTAEHRKVKHDDISVVDRLDYEKMALLVKGLYRVVMDYRSEKEIREIEFVQSVVDNELP